MAIYTFIMELQTENKPIAHFLYFLRCALGTASINDCPTLNEEEWQYIWEESRRQTVAGLIWGVIEKIPMEKRPARELLLRWYAVAERIKHSNEILNKTAVDLVDVLQKDGFSSVILKGQGLALLYPEPMARTSGDIDIWVSGGRKRIVKYVRDQFPNEEVRYHHIGFPLYQNVEVEVHFFPSWMNVPWRNLRLQKMFRAEESRQMKNYTSLGKEDAQAIPVPTADFNAVYILLHIFRHLLGEGIGLRQVIDYYYVLKNLSTAEHKQVVETLGKLGLKKFAAAMMYVQSEVLGLDEEALFISPNKKAGIFLLKEIIIAGNFGKNDPRLKRHLCETPFYRFRRSVLRDVRFVRVFTMETLFDPVFKIWHYTWQKINGYR